MPETIQVTEPQFHTYQKNDIEAVFASIERNPLSKLVYQLPTGGGKTVVFSEIARRYIEKFGRAVTILTHRRELCRQTATTLTKIGVPNRVISAETKTLKPGCDCHVAMVETLRNRIKSNRVSVADVGLVIIDEAHHNSFRKLLAHFKNACVIGVTATPFSSDVSKPMNRYYQSLVCGADISSLIAGGFLAKPELIVYEVELNTLKTGAHGDFTVSSSNELYGSPPMVELLLTAYRTHALGKKTLIFNNGIATSEIVRDAFENAGIQVRHLDNKTPAEDRKAILAWFRKTKGAVLTSVSILTTGFDEPGVQAVILNRATTSITLYHQMIGRGARMLPSKKKFRIIDLGNNSQRFGEWQQPVDWEFAFRHPDEFARQLNQSSASSPAHSHSLPAELRAQFPNTLEMTFDIEANFQEALDNDKKPKTVIQQSIRQQALMCIDNADTLSTALSLAEKLAPEIEWRVKEYVKCIGNASKNYKSWLLEDYIGRLKALIIKVYPKVKKSVSVAGR